MLTLPIRLLSAALLLFALVIGLGFAVDDGHFRAFDLTVSDALNMQRGVTPEWLILTMQGVSWIGGGAQRYVIVAILTLALWRWWGWGAALAMGLTTLVSAFTSDVMKAFFGRVRPDLVPQLDIIHSPAFPSGHSNNAAVVYILFIMLVPQARHPLWRAAAAVMIVLTGISRIMLGVHWPTDVLGGWMLGTSFALAAAAIIAYRQRQRTAHFPSVLSP
ncbi:phosphatase PAP2 family protein [Sphingorhabdus sp. IMCC26285]|uniref:Phosphatase PAP2 family protein n=1 Tax=Sphingorhabdus profundilacus TaxID=2509718 RepID=A0A6I4LVQ4_9SPHN|nr:phosphatase PAP2 family protein [Sphingorhabdus profundilacus]MVZ96939.1 phosphatase PAP2 family protein [Sphingorhabdus profundilacus]